LGRTWPNKIVNSVAISATSFFSGRAGSGWGVFLLSPEQIPWVKQYFSWIEAEISARASMQVDQLTVVMLLVVTGVGWLIHIYSMGYMAHEGGYYRFCIP
jgi:NADH-quinone oxidoreductase subunit L